MNWLARMPPSLPPGQRSAYEKYLCKELRKEEEEEENRVLLQNAKEESDPSIATLETARLDCTRCGKEKSLFEFKIYTMFLDQICRDCYFRYYKNKEIDEEDEKSLSIWEKIWCAASVPLEDLQTELMARVKRWRRCPNCRFYIQRIGHVTRMTSGNCTLTIERTGEFRFNTIGCRCGTKFCYDCGDIPRQGKCSCNRFDCLQIFPAIWSEVYSVFYGLMCDGCFRICED